MAWYNMLSNLEINNNLTSWRFRVKILRVYSYKVFGDGPYWTYILADEEGTKTSMVIYPSQASRFTGFRDQEGNWVEKRLQDQEGKWVEIFRVKVERAFIGFKPVQSPYRFTVLEGTRIKPIDPLTDQHYMDFKAIHQIKYTDTDNPIDIMGVVCNVEPLNVCYADRKKTKFVFYIRDNIENRIKCVARGDTAYTFRDDYANCRAMGVVIVVLKMWRIHKYLTGDEEPWLETFLGLSDFSFNPQIEEVADFMRELQTVTHMLKDTGLLFLSKLWVMCFF